MTTTDPIGRAAAGWHALPVEQVQEALGVGPDGLSAAAARERLARYGPNRLRPPRRRGPLARFLVQFHNVLIYVLLGAAVMTAALAHWVDTAVILGVVVINALIGFIQEGKAESALEAIRNMLSLQATVQRDGAAPACCRPRSWCRAISCSCSRATRCRPICAWSGSAACRCRRRR